MRIFSILILSTAGLSFACSSAIVDLSETNSTSETTNSTATAETNGDTTTTTTGTSNSDSDSATSGNTGSGPSTASSSTTNETSTSGDTGSTSDASTSASDTDGTTTTGSTTTGTGTTTTSSTTTTGTTAGGDECYDLDQSQCEETLGCMSLFAKKVDLLKHCTFPIPEFQGCIPEGFCGDAITYACPIDIDPKETYEFLDTCIPIDFVICDTPLLSGDCE